jgi:hypothetical protein
MEIVPVTGGKFRSCHVFQLLDPSARPLTSLQVAINKSPSNQGRVGRFNSTGAQVVLLDLQAQSFEFSVHHDDPEVKRRTEEMFEKFLRGEPVNHGFVLES